MSRMAGKTDVFQQQIEDTQQKLAPWTEKATAEEAEIALATAQRDLLQQEALTGGPAGALRDVRERMTGVKEEQATLVCNAFV